MNNILVVDIGNSYVKIGLINNENVMINKILMKTKECKVISFLKKILIENFPKGYFNKCIIGSVVPPKTKDFFTAIKSVYKISPYLISKNSKTSFKFENIKRNDVGDDVLALAEYCYKKNKNSSIGFSFGTAMFAIYIKNESLMGAIIAPGIGTSYSKLLKKASLINIEKLNKRSTKIYGNDTISALESGVNIIRKGFVLSVYDSIKDKNVCCILTGGESFEINVEFKYEIDENAILLGFKFIYDLNNIN